MREVSKEFTARRRETARGQYVYDVYGPDGKKVCKATSWSRKYVALLIHLHKPNGKYYVNNRFGRWELVGKGDSRHYINNPDFILVAVDYS